MDSTNDWLPVSLPSSNYAYSEPIPIKTWRGGSLTAKVGYVKKHPEINIICIEKVWSNGGAGRQSLNIKKGDWQGIKEVVERLLPEIGEMPTAENIEEVVEKLARETKLLEIIAKYPALLSQIPDDIDILSLPSEQKNALRSLLTTGGAVAQSVIEKLSAQPIQDLEKFSALLNDLKLSTINSLVTHVAGRLKFIDVFEGVIHDDSSYERRGSESVHNLLRANIWLIDRNYTVLHDDQTLKKIILSEWDKEYSGVESAKRPDFLCMTDRQGQESGYKKLVIIEIKRPSVKITMDHVSQVMSYKNVLQSHSGNGDILFSCFVVGREIEENLRLNPLSSSGFTTKTYTDFIGDARKFYSDYREIIGEEEFAF
jgi:hypothetical protein